jgi:hypothetical protein
MEVTEQVRKVARRVSGGPTHPLIVAVMAIVGAMAGQLAVELGAGRVPVPAGYLWLVPIAVSGLVTLGLYLPSPASRGGKMDR